MSRVVFPDKFLDHLDGLPGFSGDEFTLAHEQAPPTSIRLNPFKSVDLPFDLVPIPWSQHGFYLPQRPSFTFDPLFHAGAYYVQEASSQLIEPFVRQLVDLDKPLRVLDLCAAPGGKSTHLLSLINDQSILVSNEVIRSRTGVLSDNVEKWGCANVIITQADPAVLGTLNGVFDLIVVDAPCSGSGLFRKDPDAMDHWSVSAVDHCAGRQKRIIRDIWSALREGGILLYSTCSFSAQEDEDIISWILSEFSAEPVSVDALEKWGVTPAGGGYKCWPHRLGGEGFFIAALRKCSSVTEYHKRGTFSISRVSKTNSSVLADWFQADTHALIEWRDLTWAFPADHLQFLEQVGSVCDPIRIGTRLGAWSHKDWIPDHALALSRFRSANIPTLELDRDESIRYLQRGLVERSGLSRGWHLVTYRGQTMGWVKSVGSRINNYYPSHLRILKQTPH